MVMARHPQTRQERRRGAGLQVAGLTPAALGPAVIGLQMKGQETVNPLAIRFLGAQGIMVEAHDFQPLIMQAGLGIGPQHRAV